MKLSLIAAIDEENGLGKDNELLCHLPLDLKYFKNMTLNKTIIMGYNTFLSIGKALPHRQNIVLTRKENLQEENVVFVDTIDKALALAESEDVMIVGGGMLYRQTIDKATTLYVTRIHHRFEADVFFPDIDLKRWRCVSEEKHQKDEKHRYDFTFLRFERNDE